jgi:hypothetical protein
MPEFSSGQLCQDFTFNFSMYLHFNAPKFVKAIVVV